MDYLEFIIEGFKQIIVAMSNFKIYGNVSFLDFSLSIIIVDMVYTFFINTAKTSTSSSARNYRKGKKDD